MNGTKVLGLAAIAAVLVMAAPVERAGAVSLINPGAASAVQDDTRQLTTEVRWGHHHGWHRGWGHHRHWGWHRGWHHHRHWGWHRGWRHHRHWGWHRHRWHRHW